MVIVLGEKLSERNFLHADGIRGGENDGSKCVCGISGPSG